MPSVVRRLRLARCYRLPQKSSVVRLDGRPDVAHTAVRQLNGLAIEDLEIWVELREMSIDDPEELLSHLRFNRETKWCVEVDRLFAPTSVLLFRAVLC